MKGAAPASGEEQGASRIVAPAVERFAGPPVLHDFVIVPLRKDRHFGIEIPQVRVEEVVFVVAAIVVEVCCNLALFFGDDISPCLAIWQRLLSRYCAVRVNAVTAMDKKVRPIVQHRPVCAHAAARKIDTPALARGVARPHERNRASISRRSPKASDTRLTDSLGRPQILESQPIENVLSGRQVFDQRLSGKIRLGQRVGERGVTNLFEAVCRGRFNQHASGPVRTSPHHARIDRHIAGLHAVRDDWPL